MAGEPPQRRDPARPAPRRWQRTAPLTSESPAPAQPPRRRPVTPPSGPSCEHPAPERRLLRPVTPQWAPQARATPTRGSASRLESATHLSPASTDVTRRRGSWEESSRPPRQAPTRFYPVRRSPSPSRLRRSLSRQSTPLAGWRCLPAAQPEAGTDPTRGRSARWEWRRITHLEWRS